MLAVLQLYFLQSNLASISSKTQDHVWFWRIFCVNFSTFLKQNLFIWNLTIWMRLLKYPSLTQFFASVGLQKSKNTIWTKMRHDAKQLAGAKRTCEMGQSMRKKEFCVCISFLYFSRYSARLHMCSRSKTTRALAVCIQKSGAPSSTTLRARFAESWLPSSA